MPPKHVVQLQITLNDVEPAVWRRLLVPADGTLDALHRILQTAMGWEDYHLHAFQIGDDSYGPDDIDDDPPDDQIDERSVTIADVLAGVERFSYEYDFGDGWEHEVVVEHAEPLHAGLKFAVCLAGENACPPEDCGGPGGYARLLQVLADKSHPDYERMLEWVPVRFVGPTHFDLAVVNASLQRVK